MPNFWGWVKTESRANNWVKFKQLSQIDSKDGFDSQHWAIFFSQCCCLKYRDVIQTMIIKMITTDNNDNIHNHVIFCMIVTIYFPSINVYLISSWWLRISLFCFYFIYDNDNAHWLLSSNISFLNSNNILLVYIVYVEILTSTNIYVKCNT